MLNASINKNQKLTKCPSEQILRDFSKAIGEGIVPECLSADDLWAEFHIEVEGCEDCRTKVDSY